MSVQRPAQRAPSSRVERAVLLVGGAVAILLVIVASSLRGAPRAVGEAELSDAAGRVADEVERGWRTSITRPDAVLAPDERSLRWARTAPSPSATARALRAEPTAVDSTFDALFDESRRAEQRSEIAEAYDTLVAALVPHLDPVREARGRLAALQLALRLGNGDRAREHWQVLAQDGGDAAAHEEPTSALLLGGLAIEGILDASERAALRQLIVERWTDGRLTLAPYVFEVQADERGLSAAAPIALRVLIGRIQNLDTEPDGRLELWMSDRAAEAIAEYCGGLPRDGRVGEAGWRFGETHALFYVALDQDTYSGRAESIDRALERLRGAILLTDPPKGFSVALAGREGSGRAVRPAQTLAPGLTFTIHHDDPDGFITDAGKRFGFLRAALFLLSALVLVTAVLSHQALVRQRRLQEQKERFIASVSHELRTPVSAILLTTESLVDGRARTPERLSRYHGLVRAEAMRLQRLVENVLDVTRIGRGGGVRIERGRVELAGFADSLKEESRARVEAAGLAFESAVKVELSAADLDPEALRRAVRNLIENAILHAHSESVRLEIETAGSPRETLALRVVDRGRGIGRGNAERLFEAFRQGDHEDEPARGTGLGLAIVREIARAHGGEVRYTPGPDGAGSSFEITLPIQSSASTQA